MFEISTDWLCILQTTLPKLKSILKDSALSMWNNSEILIWNYGLR